jgi:hypothetical protein
MPLLSAPPACLSSVAEINLSLANPGTFVLDPVPGVPNSALDYQEHLETQMPSMDPGSVIMDVSFSLPDFKTQWAFMDHYRWGMDLLGTIPRQMVLETQTPWCHPRLYEHRMPRSMQGVCVLLSNMKQY